MYNLKEYKTDFYYPSDTNRETQTDTQPGPNSTSRVSFRSIYSKPESTSSYSVKRLNQITPTPKLNKKKQHNLEKQSERNKNRINKDLLPSFGSGQSRMTNSISYSSIKPKIGFQKYMVLCGMQRGQSSNGCSCFNPCKWRKSWTKDYNPNNHKLYANLLKQVPQQDIHRTYPDCPTFSRNQQFPVKLKEVLITYSVYDPQLGYAQGMNMIAAVLLYHIKQAQKTFWALVDLMDDQELRMIYYGELQQLKKHSQIIKGIVDNRLTDLSQHMEEVGIVPDVFFYGWILSLMSSCIPLEYMHLVIEKFRNSGWNFIYQLIITYLVFLKQRLLMCQDSSQFLMFINTENAKEIGIHWEEMIENCHKVQF